eukprot:scaffold77814_cov67-Phaeocystis_antarctica.AAC.9
MASPSSSLSLNGSRQRKCAHRSHSEARCVAPPSFKYPVWYRGISSTSSQRKGGKVEGQGSHEGSFTGGLLPCSRSSPLLPFHYPRPQLLASAKAWPG